MSSSTHSVVTCTWMKEEIIVQYTQLPWWPTTSGNSISAVSQILWPTFVDTDYSETTVNIMAKFSHYLRNVAEVFDKSVHSTFASLQICIYTHCRELMESVESNGNLSLLYMKADTLCETGYNLTCCVGSGLTWTYIPCTWLFEEFVCAVT